jgi:hypothetical protein
MGTKNVSFAFSNVAATKDLLGFYIPSHSIQFAGRSVLLFLVINWPPGN